jgi:L-asparaginase
MTSSLSQISLFLAAGTLPSRAGSRTEFVRYAPWMSGRDRMTGDELLVELPELHAIAKVKVDGENPHEVATPGDLRDFSHRIGEELRRQEVDGVVIVQGTNSLEETAFFLHLTVDTEKPVVVTGAQRPFTALSTDGPANLLDAMRVAVAPEARGKGVLAVANNEIHSGRDVSKTSTYRLQTFASRDLGPLGFADADRIVFYRAPLRRHTAAANFNLNSDLSIPRVDVLYVHAGANGDLARAAVELGASGLVIAGSGAGATGDMRNTLASLQREKNVVVVRSSRVGGGRVLADDNWQEPGMIAADNLNPQKAAILLALALTRTRDPVDIQNIFDTY